MTFIDTHSYHFVTLISIKSAPVLSTSGCQLPGRKREENWSERASRAALAKNGDKTKHMYKVPLKQSLTKTRQCLRDMYIILIGGKAIFYNHIVSSVLCCYGCCRRVFSLTLSIKSKNKQTRLWNISRIFSQKMDFDIPCKLSPRRQFAWNVKTYFLENI